MRIDTLQRISLKLLNRILAFPESVLAWVTKLGLTFEMKRPWLLPRRKLGENHNWELGHSTETSVEKISEVFQSNGFYTVYQERFLDRAFFYFRTKTQGH